MKREQPNTLFPIDTTQGENLRPISQVSAIITGLVFGTGLIISVISDIWK